ncbi:MAG TPA: hypothetical protein VL329_09330 [Nitrospiraceae bacterium]|nr:hypothetical protein [Nitrospiraceae bacterium]
MRRRLSLHVIFPLFIATLVVMPVAVKAESSGPSQGHREVTGVVTGEKSGLLTVKLPDGSTMTLNPKIAERHGHATPKVGDEVTLVLNENNAIIDHHPKGDKGHHKFVTGKLAYVGLMKNQIKLITSEGEKLFPLERQEIKTGGIEEGALVTVELNEAGTVIDLHRAEHKGDKH